MALKGCIYFHLSRWTSECRRDFFLANFHCWCLAEAQLPLTRRSLFMLVLDRPVTVMSLWPHYRGRHRKGSRHPRRMRKERPGAREGPCERESYWRRRAESAGCNSEWPFFVVVDREWNWLSFLAFAYERVLQHIPFYRIRIRLG